MNFLITKKRDIIAATQNLEAKNFRCYTKSPANKNCLPKRPASSVSANLTGLYHRLARSIVRRYSGILNNREVHFPAPVLLRTFSDIFHNLISTPSTCISLIKSSVTEILVKFPSRLTFRGYISRQGEV